jgi:transcriptional regulator with XRE-family HTH domain
VILIEIITMKTHDTAKIPIPVQRALRKLGEDIRDARRRRRISMAIVAERASISRPSLSRVEKGDPSVSLGIYARVLFVLGLAERLGDLADVKSDALGLALEDERLPQRIRHPKRPKPAKPRGKETR